MVAANYVRFFPLSYFSEPPAQLPIRYSPTQFAELLPKQVLEHYRDAAKVTSLKRHGDKWIVQDDLTLGRGIAIRFEGDCPDSLYFYNLFAQEIRGIEEESRIVRVVLTLPDEPPSTEEFKIWVAQSINSAAHAHFETLTTELALASQCNAMYLTNSAFAAELLDSHTDATHNVRTETTRFVLKMNLPFLQNVTTEDVMSARATEGEAFDLFRRELERQFLGLRLERDPQKLQTKMENAVHELTEIQVTRVEQTVARLRKKLAAEVTVAMAGLAGTVATSGWSLLATVVAAVQGYDTFAEYQKNTHENPAYFLWKVMRS